MENYKKKTLGIFSFFLIVGIQRWNWFSVCTAQCTCIKSCLVCSLKNVKKLVLRSIVVSFNDKRNTMRKPLSKAITCFTVQIVWNIYILFLRQNQSNLKQSHHFCSGYAIKCNIFRYIVIIGMSAVRNRRKSRFFFAFFSQFYGFVRIYLHECHRREI